MKKLLASLRRDPTGAVAVEFALWCTLFFLVALGGFDLADLYFQRGKMGSAVSAASLQAFDKREQVAFSDLPGYVRALAERETMDVTVQCNGVKNSCTNTNRTCACLAKNGSFAARACGSTCDGGSQTPGVKAGYYLTITVGETYQPTLIPASITGTRLTQSATVRLQ